MPPGRRLAAHVALSVLLVTLIPAGTGSAADANSERAASCALNIRAKPTTAATMKTRIPAGTIVTVSAVVRGGTYATPCGRWVSGSRWYAITAIGGRSVPSMFGVPRVYAASRLFRSAPVLEGIDVSQWQGEIDFAEVRSSGKRFVIAKATEGRLYTDPAYRRNRAGALAAGLLFTAYHYAHPDPTPRDAVLEADHFVAVAQLRRGMLVPVLDIESGAGLGTRALTEWVTTWLARVYSRLHVRAMIYTTPAFWRSAMDDTAWFARHGYRMLWIAHWDVESPSVPASDWDGQGWRLWQSSSCGTVAGIGGCVDLDYLRASGSSGLTY